MITTINNNERVFYITTSNNRSAFCNLAQLNEVIAQLGTHEGYFTIYHFWDGKQKKVSRKYLKDLFAAHKIEPTFYY